MALPDHGPLAKGSPANGQLSSEGTNYSVEPNQRLDGIGATRLAMNRDEQVADAQCPRVPGLAENSAACGRGLRAWVD